jgi:6-phosphogluconolactonase (cycloisomerase 2 family)
LDNGGCRAQYQQGNDGYNPGWVAIDGTGKFLYGVNQYFGNISIYSISSTGSLTFIKNTASLEQPCPFAPIVTDPAGNYLYEVGCANNYAITFNTVLGYTINHSTGDLTPAPGSPFLTNKDFNVLGVTTTP